MKKDYIKGVVRHTMESKFELVENKKQTLCFKKGILKEQVRKKTLMEIFRLCGMCSIDSGENG